jgi:hypothetical protein
MKCFTIWIDDDGTAQVAELTPEQGQSLIDQVDAQPAASVEEGMQMLQGMVSAQGEAGNESGMAPEDKMTDQQIWNQGAEARKPAPAQKPVMPMRRGGMGY